MTDPEKRNIAERTAFLAALTWSPEDQSAIEQIIEWIADYPDRAAEYIHWLEENNE